MYYFVFCKLLRLISRVVLQNSVRLKVYLKTKHLIFHTLLVSGSLNVTAFESVAISSGNFVDIIPSRRSVMKIKDKPTDETVESDDSETTEPNEPESPKLFSCTIDGCVRSFQRYSSLEYHLEYGKCELKPERLSLMDKAKVMYTEKLMHGASEQTTMKSSDAQAKNEESMLPQGWALKASKSNTRFNEKQKQYLNEKFDIGKETGHKLDPASVSRDMRYAKDVEGNRRFALEDFLIPQQIQSFFSRRSSKEKKGQVNTHDDRVSAEEQEAYTDVRSAVLNECQLQHPVVFDSYNLCSLCSKNTLKKFSVSLLKQICEHFHVDTSGVSTVRLKAPYINLIKDMIKSCSCSSS